MARSAFLRQVRHAKTIPIPGDAADHALQNLVVLMDAVRREVFLSPVRRSFSNDRPKAQRVHDRQRPRAHGENVAQNAAHAGGCTLITAQYRTDDCAIRF